jgi:kynurenine formamidase
VPAGGGSRPGPFGFTRVVFLSHVLTAGGPVFPGDPPVEIRLENLAGLGEMPPAGGWIIVGGVRIRGGTGSPATVSGLIP